MPQDDTEQRPPETDNTPRKGGVLERLRTFDRGLDLVKGLSVVGVLSSVVVGYFQYLGAYQEKVSNQAREDMAAATTTFTEISGAFSEIQALQQILYGEFIGAIRDKSDASDQALGTKNAKEISDAYEKARTTLRENIDVLARKAEVYIDWASDIYRDPAGRRNVDDDPLSRSLLRDYKFDCADKSNFPAFGNVNAVEDKSAQDTTDENFCASGKKQIVGAQTLPQNAFIRICAGADDKHARRIYWYSAKHHVLTMHYCFEAAHDRLAAVRQWASKSDRDTPRESEIVKGARQVNAELDDLALRLSSFNSLALFQMERIRVKYRPVGFLCTVPLLRNVLSASCLPLRTATNENH